MGATSIRKSLARGAKQAKKLALSMLAVLLVASGISVSSVSGSSVAYADVSYGSTSTVEGITFQKVGGTRADWTAANSTLTADLLEDILADSTGYLYFNEVNLTGYSSYSSGAVIESGTVTDGNVTISVNTDYFDLRANGTSTASDSASAYAYEISTKNQASDTTVNWDNGNNPLITITIKHAGYTSDGNDVDIEIQLFTVQMVAYNSSYTNDNGVMLMRFNRGTDLLVDGFTLGSLYAGIMTRLNVNFTYSTSGESLNVSDGYDYVWEFTALNVRDQVNNSEDGIYAESICLRSGFYNTVYYGGGVQVSTASHSPNTYARVVRDDAASSTTVYDGLMTKMSGGFSFDWHGSGCVSNFSLGSLQDQYQGELTVENTASGSYGDTTKDFSYEVELTYGNDNALSSTLRITYSDASGQTTTGTVTFTNGRITAVDGNTSVTTISLGLGESFTISGLPAGAKYTVTQVADTNYTTTASGTVSGTNSPAPTVDTETSSGTYNRKVTGSISAGESATITFTNARKSGNLAISKTVSASDYADTSDETFTFTVTLTDTFADGSSNVITDSFSVSGDGLDVSSVTFTAAPGGSTTSFATITLKDGQTATITGLPSGVSYTVEETDYDAGFTVSPSSATGTISATTASTAAFTNTTKKDLEVIIYKFATTTGGKTNLAGAEYSIVALDSSGNEVESTKQTNQATESDGTLNVSNLEALTVYKVTETKAAAGYYLLDETRSFYIKIVDGKLQLVNASGAALTGNVSLDGGTVSLDAKNDLQVNVESTLNTTSALLPTTGGSGTLLFFVAGAALVALAAYALYRQRRSSMYAHAAHAASPYQAHASSSYASYVPLSQVLKSRPYASHAASAYQVRASKHRPTRRRVR